MVEALQAWEVRWVGGLGAEDLDPHLLMWDMKRTMAGDRWPVGHTVVALTFGDVEPRAARWWICVRDDQVDVCDYDPGFDVTARVTLTLRTLSEIWRGDRTWAAATWAGLVDVDAPRSVRQDLPGWLGQSSAALVPRPRRTTPA